MTAAVALSVACGSWAVAVPSIFDEDYKPPKRADPPPAVPPPVVPPAAPVPTDPPSPQPPASAKPDLVKPPAADLPTILAAPPAAARRGVPAAADQAKSRALMREVFAAQLADRTPAGRRKLVDALLAEAAKAADNPADRFVLLGGAVQAARDAGDLSVGVRAADEMAAAYAVDALAIKADVAGRMTLAADPSAAAAGNLKAGLDLLDQLVAAEDYAAAARVAAALQPAAAKDPAARASLQQRTRDVAAQRAARDKVAPHVERLKVVPNDPAARYAVGGYYCFTKNNWDAGLTLLAGGNNPLVKAAADADLAGPADAAGRVAAGDAWWSAADREPAGGPAQPAMRARAAGWYRQALATGELTGLSRARLEKRIEGLPKSDAGRGPTVVAGPARWISTAATYTVSSESQGKPPLPSLLTGLSEAYDNNAFRVHTRDEPDAHLVIDLGERATVSRVDIANRRDQLMERAKTLTVWVSAGRNGPWQEVWRAPDVRKYWSAVPAKPVEARYVKLGLREKNPLHLFAVRVYGWRPGPPSAGGGVVLYTNNSKRLQPVLSPVGGGAVRVVYKDETAAALVDPETYAGIAVVVVDMNVWRDTSKSDLTEAAMAALRKFVEGGGDLVFLEQFGTGNMSLVDKAFGIKTGGGHAPAVVADPELKAKLAAAGVTDEVVRTVTFYNSYDRLPAGARVLVRAADSGEAGMVVAPFGKGRLVLLGTATDGPAERLNAAVFDLLYPAPVAGKR